MPIDYNEYRELTYENGLKLYFHKEYSFHDHFHHIRKTTRFPYHKNILEFLTDNPSIKIFFTLNPEIKAFQIIDEGFVVNMIAYQNFCKTIGSKTGGRAKAFLGQNISINDINFSESDKDEFIKLNASEKNIIDSIKNFSPEAQQRITNAIESLDQANKDASNSEKLSVVDVIDALSNFLNNPELQSAFYSKLPRVQIELLKSYREFLLNNLDKNETFIQDWLDEENGKYRKQRCLIFGIEYVDPKREGEFMRKRFDILAEQNLDCHILIELKSPNAEIFSIKEHQNNNEGIQTEYSLSNDIARAIPQILGYKAWYESARPEEIQALGIEKKHISKCIIVAGTRKEDTVWKQNFQHLKESLNIELYTYSDLIDRLDNTIKNLEQSL